MRQRTVTYLSLVAGTVLFHACSDSTQPTSPSADKTGFDPIQQPDDPVAQVRGIPGFGGFFFDRDGAPTVYLRDVSERAQVERALGPWLVSQGVGPAVLRVRRADYDWASLERWQGRATGTALAMRGVLWVDADEARNRVTIGVERGTPAAQVRSAVARLGVPSAAVVVEEGEPVRLLAKLQDRVRPVVGALQINFDPDPAAPGSFVCTLGFNATRNGNRFFITNSHCTNAQGGNESTPYWQPTRGVAPTRIGTEVADPVYTTGGGGGPPRQWHHLDARQNRAHQRREQRLAHDKRELHDHGRRQRGLWADGAQDRADNRLDPGVRPWHLCQHQRRWNRYYPALPDLGLGVRAWG
jgi:hypothetical protein